MQVLWKYQRCVVSIDYGDLYTCTCYHPK